MSVEFQRLADVRARRSARRRRRLRALSIGGVAGAILAASGLAARSLPAGREASAVDEEARGPVSVVQPAAGIIRIASGFLGLMSVDLKITAETVIVVGDKEGGLGDLRGEVRAVYDRGSAPWRAKRVELLGVQSSSSGR